MQGRSRVRGHLVGASQMAGLPSYSQYTLLWLLSTWGNLGAASSPAFYSPDLVCIGG